MSFSRRAFVQTLGVGAAGVTAAMVSRRSGSQLLDMLARGVDTPLYAAETTDILCHNNENPVGPGEECLQAIRTAFGPGGVPIGRYPFSRNGPVTEAIAAKFGVRPENVLLGNGSTQLLRTLTHISCSADKALVGSEPTYEECAGYAALIGAPVKSTKLTSDLKMDLDATMAAARGAGMVFFCNPSNPTATAHTHADSVDFINGTMQASPETMYLVDEAYYDYATDPNYATLIPMAVETPQVVVCRTFSKAYGMAGLRLGYAIGHADTIKRMSDWDGTGSINMAAYASGLAAIERGEGFIEAERARNTAARTFTREFFHNLGYQDSDSQTNFIFVNVNMPVERFQAACREGGVRVGRPFPPLTTYCRISISTMEDMQKATEVFGNVLSAAQTAAAA